MVYIQTQDELLKYLPEILALKRVGFDIETTGLDFFKDKVLLIIIGNSEEQYLIDARTVNPEPLRGWFENQSIRKRGHNLGFDYKFMKTNFGIAPEGLVCTFLMEITIENGRITNRYPSLKHVLKKYINIELDKTLQTSFINHVGSFTNEQLEYACGDVKHMYDLVSAMCKGNENLFKIFKIECDAIPAFCDMEINGIGFDSEKWINNKKENEKKRSALELEMWNEIKHMFSILPGFDNEVMFDFNSPIKVLDLLKRMNIMVEHVEYGEIVNRLIQDTNDNTLVRIKNNKLITLLREHRTISKSINSFGDNFLPFVKNGRIYFELNQLGCENGRPSSKSGKFNPLNIPRDSNVRKCFVGKNLNSCDYSAIEPRIGAELSQDPKWLDCYQRGEDPHSYAGSMLFGKTITKTNENKALRTPAKELNLGIVYGMQYVALRFKIMAQGFDISLEETKKLRNKYCKMFNVYNDFLEKNANLAVNHMQLSNINGRRRFWKSDTPEWMIKTAAKNHNISSVNADIIKIAMTNLRRCIIDKKYNALLILQVYDELLTECFDERVKEFEEDKIRIMIEAGQTVLKTVPCLVDSHTGDFWTK